MPSNTLDYFKMVIIIQILFGLVTTMVAYSLPSDDYVSISSQLTPEEIESMENISGNLTSDVRELRNPSDINLPIVETAVLLFKTGNIVIDALLNSLFAIPSMATILVTGMCVFVPIDPFFASVLSVTIYAIIAILYIIGVIALIVNMRSSGGISNVV